MAAALTTTSRAVLGLLALRPWTTYELAKQVRRSLSWFWPRAERKLYDEPKRLVDAGLATARAELVGRRARTVYTITDAGRADLRAWLSEPSAPPSFESEAMVKLFFADAGTVEQLRAVLQDMHDGSAARRAQLEGFVADHLEHRSAFPDRAALNALALRLQIEHERALFEWSRWALDEVSTWRHPSDPAAAARIGHLLTGPLDTPRPDAGGAR